MKIRLFTLLCILVSSAYHTFAQENDGFKHSMAVGKLPSSIKRTTYLEATDINGYYNHLYFDESPAYQVFRDGKILISLLDRETKIKKIQRTLEREKR